MKSNLTAVVVALLLGAIIFPAAAHKFSAGEPGDPKKPARVIKVTMREDGKKMLFEPAHITVRKGGQIRFVLNNDGTESHEFVLATIPENRKHAELMKKYPHMEHDDPNARRLDAVHRRRDRVEIHPARDIRIWLPDPRAPRSRHARHD